MKKSLIGILLCAVLLVSLLPVTAAGAESYKLWVNGEQFTSDKLVITCGEGTATLRRGETEDTITLHNATITGHIENSGIWGDYSKPLNIIVEGENSISVTENFDTSASAGMVKGIRVNSNLTLSLNSDKDPGSLNITVDEFDSRLWTYGIYVGHEEKEPGKLTLKDITLNFTPRISDLIFAHCTDVEVDNATLHLKASNLMESEVGLTLLPNAGTYYIKAGTNFNGTGAAAVDGGTSADFDWTNYKYLEIRPKTEITSVRVMGLTAPGIGQSAADNLASVWVADDADYTVSEAEWWYSTDEKSWSTMSGSKIFNAEYYYKYRVYLAPKEGYIFPPAKSTGDWLGYKGTAATVGLDYNYPSILAKTKNLVVFGNVLQPVPVEYGISAASETADSATVSLSNKTDETVSLKFVLAVYGADGRMLSLASAPASLEAGSSTSLTVSYPGGAESKRLNAFVIQSDMLTPLRDVWSRRIAGLTE